ncbi:cytochrome P450 [Cytophagaceae bacterium ABcell3]|nr:cytochrome P450 [Cytophagaceae bacterium ABcell3]
MDKKILKTDRFPFNWIEMGKDPLKFFASRTLKHNDMVDVGFFPGVATYILTNPDFIEHVLVKNNRNYIKSKSYLAVKRLLGNGLLTNEGEFWKRQRRIAQPAFHRKVLAGFTDSIQDITKELSTQWQENMKAGQAVINIADEMMKLTTRITSRLLFGTDISNKEEDVVHWVGEVNHCASNMIKVPLLIPLWIPTPNNRRFIKGRDALFKIIEDIISKRRSSKENSYNDLLQMLMDARDEDTGEGMSDEQLRDEVITLFLAGSETSSNAMTWTLYLFNQNRDKEEKAREEICSILKRGLNGLEAMKEMRYLSACMNESLRIFPPAWFLGREALEDDTIDGYKIPKGAQLYIPVHGLHVNPAWWSQPDKFIPERFEETSDRPKYAYFPFGGGPRLCIGVELAKMEILFSLFKLLQEFEFENINDNATPEALITLRPKNGLLMKVKKRG